MAERGILILDQVDGSSIACRDAAEPDDLSNPRVIQRLSLSKGRIPSPLGTPTRTLVTAQDTNDLESLPADLTDNLVEMGDKTRLVVIAEFMSSSYSSEVHFNLLMFNDDPTPEVVAYMIGDTIAAEMGGKHYTRTGGASSISEVITFESVLGARLIGIQCNQINNAGTGINLWAFPY